MLCYDGYLTPQIRRINIIVLVPVIIAAAKIRRTVRTISSRIASG
ncbi:5-methylaminomethyl-2-thiouridine methyltransferase [Escherichia phage 500465-2]|nr:5-methylaminomethyl-2-thiouridine methyltransferase [Escherichia phage 500465-2]